MDLRITTRMTKQSSSGVEVDSNWSGFLRESQLELISCTVRLTICLAKIAETQHGLPRTLGMLRRVGFCKDLDEARNIPVEPRPLEVIRYYSGVGTGVRRYRKHSTHQAS